MPVENEINNNGLILALDDIRDPGNLGTILRLCDWFGIKQIVCSKETVDIYNPKVVQATMGSITRVNVNYVDLKTYLSQTKLPVFGTFMDGETIYKKICLKMESLLWVMKPMVFRQKLKKRLPHD